MKQSLSGCPAFHSHHGFSLVTTEAQNAENRFNGFAFGLMTAAHPKPLKRLKKTGVNLAPG
jgi:hypothetical protein